MGFLEALGSAGPYTNNLHLAPDSLPLQHQSLSFYRLAPNQQCQNTEGTELIYEYETTTMKKWLTKVYFCQQNNKNYDTYIQLNKQN